MSDTLFEYYDTGADDGISLQNYGKTGQTFTPDTGHKITSVELRLYRAGSPGTVTIGIFATDGEGHPTGSALCSGTTNGNTLTTSTSGEWREITFESPVFLSANTLYAISVEYQTHDSKYVYWRFDSSSTYANGKLWFYFAGKFYEIGDAMFREYGISYLDIGLRYYDGDSTEKIGAQDLESTHKLRIAKNSSIYGLPLVDPSDPSASKIRIWDGSSAKSLVKVD